MPDPRNHIDRNYQFVGGYARRRRRTRKFSFLAFLLIFFGLVALTWIIAQIWSLVVVIVGIGILVYVLLRWKQWRHWFLMRKMRRLEEQSNRRAEEEVARTRIMELEDRR